MNVFFKKHIPLAHEDALTKILEPLSLNFNLLIGPPRVSNQTDTHYQHVAHYRAVIGIAGLAATNCTVYYGYRLVRMNTNHYLYPVGSLSQPAAQSDDNIITNEAKVIPFLLIMDTQSNKVILVPLDTALNQFMGYTAEHKPDPGFTPVIYDNPSRKDIEEICGSIDVQFDMLTKLEVASKSEEMAAIVEPEPTHLQKTL